MITECIRTIVPQIGSRHLSAIIPLLMVRKKKSAVDVETLASLAANFADQEMYEESIHLYELAIKLKPDSVAIKLNLARVKELSREKKNRRILEQKEKILQERHRDDIDAGHYIGLAEFYLKRRDSSQAVELLEISKLKNPDRPEPYVLLASHYFHEGEWDQALDEVHQARRLNPFDPSIAELEGRIFFEKKDYQEAFTSFVDAILLLPNRNHPHMQHLSQMLRTLKTILHVEKGDLNNVFRNNLEKLQMHIKRLELRREFLFSKDTRKELHDIFLKKSREGTRHQHLIKTASLLRDMVHFQHASDDQIFELSRGVRTQKLAPDTHLFREGEKSFDFFLIRSGYIVIQRETPFGAQPLATLSSGDFIGEISFIQRSGRTTDAITSKETEIFTFPSAVVDTLIEKQPDIGTVLSFAFWKSMSDKIRHSNEILKTFFSQDMKSAERMSQQEGQRTSKKIETDKKRTMDVLMEKGLSSAELSLLATFSEEERYDGGSFVFREGEMGDRLYIVLDGKIRISKFIPGIGEEALAIFDKGEFFGEMSLIDGSPRSADARAHEGPATVLAIDRKTLDEILKMDPRAAYQFLSLLNRLLCQRLVEINEKIIQWKHIVGIGG